MRIRKLTQIHSLHCWMSGHRGSGPKPVTIPILRADVEGLPSGIDALIATSDLQARETASGGPLIGELLPLMLAADVLPQFFDLDPTHVGITLCGDFYTDSRLEKRGIAGDVTDTWLEFRENFGWVIGVAGNHDSFRPIPDQLHENGCHLLNGDILEVFGMQIGGLGGVVSSKSGPHRKPEEAYVQTLGKILDAEPAPALLLMHDGPRCGPNHVGNVGVTDLIREKRPSALVIRGHARWQTRLRHIGETQILNVHESVVVMTPSQK